MSETVVTREQLFALMNEAAALELRWNGPKFRRAVPKDDGLKRLVAGLDKHKCVKTVRDRVLRLNKTFSEGAIPRGWHRKDTYRNIWDRDIKGKGACIREFGREWWHDVPKHLVHKRGRREYVTMETVFDRPKRHDRIC